MSPTFGVLPACSPRGPVARLLPEPRPRSPPRSPAGLSHTPVSGWRWPRGPQAAAAETLRSSSLRADWPQAGSRLSPSKEPSPEGDRTRSAQPRVSGGPPPAPGRPPQLGPLSPLSGGPRSPPGTLTLCCHQSLSLQRRLPRSTSRSLLSFWPCLFTAWGAFPEACHRVRGSAGHGFQKNPGRTLLPWCLLSFGLCFWSNPATSLSPAKKTKKVWLCRLILASGF